MISWDLGWVKRHWVPYALVWIGCSCGSDAPRTTPDASLDGTIIEPDATQDARLPDAGPPDRSVRELALGAQHACVRLASGEVLCWGENERGQLGDGTTEARATPTKVVDLPPAASVTVGLEHSCAALLGGGVHCWGSNDLAQLGDGSMGTDRLTPSPVVNLRDAVAISAGLVHTCARKVSGTVHCWGDSSQWQLGEAQGSSSRVPLAIDSLGAAAFLRSGDRYVGALTSTGFVYTWGQNHVGQLGEGSVSVRRALARAVINLTEVVALGIGARHGCAYTAPTQLFCWGDNPSGQLGIDPATSPAPTPVEVLLPPEDGVELAAGSEHTCLRRANGEVQCWGANDRGQLGDGTTTPRFAAMPVPGLTDAVRIFAGAERACALRASGQVVCWGDDVLKPVTVVELDF